MENPIIARLRKLLASTVRVLETFDTSDDALSLLNNLVLEYKNVSQQTRDFGEDKKIILNQLNFSINCLLGLVEAVRREQFDLPIKTHLENIRAGLDRVIVEILKHTKLADKEKPVETLQGNDWLLTLQNIRNKMIMEEVVSPLDDTSIGQDDLTIVQNLGTRAVDLLQDEPYGMITAPVIISQGRFDRAAKNIMANESYELQEFLKSYYAISNASVLGVQADVHSSSFVNEALRYVNEANHSKLDLCGQAQRVNSHFYYLLMPTKAMQNRSVAINQWAFQKKL